MANCKFCPDCGSSLDFGERCDCKKQKSAESERDGDADQDGDYHRGFRLNRGLIQKDIVQALKPMYPKISKQLITSAEKEDYGVTLRAGAFRHIKRVFGAAPEAGRKATEIKPREQKERAVVRFGKRSWLVLEQARNLVAEERAEFIRIAVAERAIQILRQKNIAFSRGEKGQKHEP